VLMLMLLLLLLDVSEAKLVDFPLNYIVRNDGKGLERKGQEGWGGGLFLRNTGRKNVS
jgi:hypothetical protein